MTHHNQKSLQPSNEMDVGLNVNRRSLLSINDAAGYLAVNHKVVRKLIKNRELAAYKIGGQYRIKPKDLETYMETVKISTIDWAIALDEAS